MPSLVVRRTKVISDKIEDLTIQNRDILDRTINATEKLVRQTVGSAEIGPGSLVDPLFKAKTISRGKLTYLTQIGSGKPGYISFPTAYSVAPGVVVSPIYDVTALGYIPEVTSVAAGSFNVTGSTGGYVRYIAVGSA